MDQHQSSSEIHNAMGHNSDPRRFASTRLTEVFCSADPSAAWSFSNPIASAARTICKHSSGVKTSSTRNAPGTPGTSTLVGARGRDGPAAREMALGEEA